MLPAVNEALRDLGRSALALGVDALRLGRPFEVFAVHLDAAGESTLHWFHDATSEAALLRARHTTATSDCASYAIASHEEIRDREGKKRPAVIVEVGDRDHDGALRMAQPYRPFLGLGQPLETLGNPMMLGDTTNVLRGSTLDPGREPAFVVVCPGCRKQNRVALGRVRARLPSCGACGKSLLEA